MLAIHWSPVKNTKRILKNGITKSQNGLYCFPLTGHKEIDNWWVKAFNQWNYRQHRNRYNGFIFKIVQEDLPAYFGYWYGATSSDTFDKEINSIEELNKEYRNNILWIFAASILGLQYNDKIDDDDYIQIVENKINNGDIDINNLLNDLDFMKLVFEDYQIVLSQSIHPKRIIKIISSQNEYGKILYKQKKYKNLTKLNE